MMNKEDGLEVMMVVVLERLFGRMEVVQEVRDWLNVGGLGWVRWVWFDECWLMDRM